jgi:hypothetical protein
VFAREIHRADHKNPSDSKTNNCRHLPISCGDCQIPAAGGASPAPNREWMKAMRKLMTIGALVAVASGLAACGQTPATRMATGAFVGAGAGALGAWAYDEDPGKAAVVGAGIGALGGLMTPPGTFDNHYPWGS